MAGPEYEDRRKTPCAKYVMVSITVPAEDPCPLGFITGRQTASSQGAPAGWAALRGAPGRDPRLHLAGAAAGLCLDLASWEGILVEELYAGTF